MIYKILLVVEAREPQQSPRKEPAGMCYVREVSQLPRHAENAPRSSLGSLIAQWSHNIFQFLGFLTCQ